MRSPRAGRAPRVVMCAALMTLTLAASDEAKAGAAAGWGDRPTVVNQRRRGQWRARPRRLRLPRLPYAAPPVGDLRWRPAAAAGVLAAGSATLSGYAPSCPQKPSLFEPPGPQSEDCLYLNVSTPTLRHNAKRPVLVWIHGGGFTQDGALNYDGAKLAADGIVVVTINYRLGALGFSRTERSPRGPAGRRATTA